MNCLEVEMAQRCPFQETILVTSFCTSKGTIFPKKILKSFQFVLTKLVVTTKGLTQTCEAHVLVNVLNVCVIQ